MSLARGEKRAIAAVAKAWGSKRAGVDLPGDSGSLFQILFGCCWHSPVQTMILMIRLKFGLVSNMLMH
jgi:hypothetical protein